MTNRRLRCHRATKWLATLAVLAVAWVAVPSPLAAEPSGWDGLTKEPQMTDLVPRLGSSESYSESYHFSADLDDGGRFQVDFRISNLGFSDGTASTKVRLRLPDEVDYEDEVKSSPGDWTHSKDSFRLETAKTTIEQKGDDAFHISHEGKHDGESIEIDVDMELRAPMWQPGRGQLTVGDGSYYQVHLTNLRSDVSGEVAVGDEKSSFAGTRSGYGDHVAMNIAPYNLADRISYAIVYGDNQDVFAIWRNVKLNESHGGDSFAYLVVGYRDQIVFSGPDVAVKQGSYQTESKSGYSIPKAVQLNGKSGGDTVKLVMRADDVHSRNLLDGRGRVIKMLASAVTKPYHFDLKGKYALEMAIQGVNATIRGDGEYHFDVLNE